MKRIVLMLVIAIGASSVALGQTKPSQDGKVEAQIIALEKAGWEAWKTKDSSWFQTNLADDYLTVHADGVINKSQVMKDWAACEVKSFSLGDFKFLMIDKDAALITFVGTQDAVCGGKVQPATVRASSVYAKRGGKWLGVFYSEIPAAQ